MKKFITNKYFLIFAGIVLLLGLWFLATLIFDKNSMIFPSPIVTFEALIQLLGVGYTYQCLAYSVLKMIIGFGLGFVVAFILALMVRDNEHLYTLFSPIITALKAIPTAAIVFLFVVLVDAEYAPCFLVMILSLPILYESLVNGMRNIDPQILDSVKIDGGKGAQKLFHVQLPLALPYLLVGIISSFSLSFKIEIMSEIVTGFTRNGLGSLIKSVQINDPTNMAAIFAYSLIAIILMIVVSIPASYLRNKVAVKAGISR